MCQWGSVFLQTGAHLRRHPNYRLGFSLLCASIALVICLVISFSLILLSLKGQRGWKCVLRGVSFRLTLIISHLFLTSALIWHFFFPPIFFLIKMDCLFIWCTSSLMQWIVWIPRAPTMASVWTGSATASQAGGGSTASCPGPSAQTSATVTGPSSPTRGCAAVIPTGWDPTVPWVSLGVKKKTQKRKSTNIWGLLLSDLSSTVK